LETIGLVTKFQTTLDKPPEMMAISLCIFEYRNYISSYFHFLITDYEKPYFSFRFFKEAKRVVFGLCNSPYGYVVDSSRTSSYSQEAVDKLDFLQKNGASPNSFDFNPLIS
jgi:hypothetical protein